MAAQLAHRSELREWLFDFAIRPDANTVVLRLDETRENALTVSLDEPWDESSGIRQDLPSHLADGDDVPSDDLVEAIAEAIERIIVERATDRPQPVKARVFVYAPKGVQIGAKRIRAFDPDAAARADRRADALAIERSLDGLPETIDEDDASAGAATPEIVTRDLNVEALRSIAAAYQLSTQILKDDLRRKDNSHQAETRRYETRIDRYESRIDKMLDRLDDLTTRLVEARTSEARRPGDPAAATAPAAVSARLGEQLVAQVGSLSGLFIQKHFGLSGPEAEIIQIVLADTRLKAALTHPNVRAMLKEPEVRAMLADLFEGFVQQHGAGNAAPSAGGAAAPSAAGSAGQPPGAAGAAS